jgi:hypothetical protein
MEEIFLINVFENRELFSRSSMQLIIFIFKRPVLINSVCLKKNSSLESLDQILQATQISYFYVYMYVIFFVNMSYFYVHVIFLCIYVIFLRTYVLFLRSVSYFYVHMSYFYVHMSYFYVHVSYFYVTYICSRK